MTKVNKFVLLSTPRTGSTYIRLWLNNHPDIRSHGEVFYGNYKSPDGFRSYCNGSTISSLSHRLYRHRVLKKIHLNKIPKKYIEEYLNSLYHNPKHSAPWLTLDECRSYQKIEKHKSNVGYKLMYYQLKETPSLNKILTNPENTIIHITRDNLVKQFLSWQRMTTSKIAHATSTKKIIEPIYLSERKLLQFIRKQEKEVKYYQNLFSSQKYLEFSYEQFFSDHDKTKEKIFNILGVENIEMEDAGIKKIGGDVITNEIINYDEIRKTLLKNNYGKYLNKV